MKVIPIIQANQDSLSLSQTEKMPCASYALPASECITGSKLRAIPGSVCSTCYAHKGRALFGTVKSSRQKRFDALPDEDDASGWYQWANHMAGLIALKEKSGYFRWFDSGDLPHYGMLVAIIRVAELLPSIKFWLPTQERTILRKFYADDYQLGSSGQRDAKLPDNLIVRVSGAMINGPVQNVRMGLTSTVYNDDGRAYGYACPCGIDRKACGDCRACWDSSIPNVSYKLH